MIILRLQVRTEVQDTVFCLHVHLMKTFRL